jgi:hypothetical protein
MRVFLAVSAVLAWVFGGALLFATSQFFAPMGVGVTPAIAVIGQAQGAILLGLGVINWMARHESGPAVRPVLAGNLVVQLTSLAVIARALALRIVPAQNAGAVVIHTLLGAGYLYFLRASGRPTISRDAAPVSRPR